MRQDDFFNNFEERKLREAERFEERNSRLLTRVSKNSYFLENSSKFLQKLVLEECSRKLNQIHEIKE